VFESRTAHHSFHTLRWIALGSAGFAHINVHTLPAPSAYSSRCEQVPCVGKFGALYIQRGMSIRVPS
jgi:hypothetical protein